MKASIISTYPSHGSKNIGDRLIEESTKKILYDVLGVSDFHTIWREDIKNNVSLINQSSIMVFACLAIRNDMFPRIYSMPESISDITIPLLVISAGTSLSHSEIVSCELGSDASFDKATISGIRAIRSKSIGFSCRGEVTFNVLNQMQINDIAMIGDVAFYEPRFDEQRFKKINSIRKIAVSTPHYPKIYKEHFFDLLFSLRQEFPKSEIHVIVHGTSDWLFSKNLEKFNCEIHDIYMKDLDSLDIYSEMDIHIGYRIHAHVSALKRRIPSYLFAIDGRGVDYCRTLRTGTTVKAWKICNDPIAKIENLAKSFIRNSLLGRKSKQEKFLIKPNYHATKYLVNLVKRDADEGFHRFIGYESNILTINNNLKNFLLKSAYSF